MGLLSKIVDLIPGESGIEQALETVADVAEGLIDGALVFAGPVGWAILGAKTAVNMGWSAMDGNPDTSALGALGEGVLSAGLGAVGGGVLKGVLPKVADAGSSLLARGAQYGTRALQGADDIARTMTTKVDDVMINSRFSSQWGNAVDDGSRLARVSDAGARYAARASDAVVGNFNRLSTQYGSRFVQASDDAAATGFRRFLTPKNMLIAGGATVGMQAMSGGGGAPSGGAPGGGGEGSAGLGAGNTEADMAMRAAFGVKEK